MSSRLRGRKVWVVGASSGIGAELARELVRRGADVAISGRRPAELAEVSGGSMSTVPADVTDPRAVVQPVLCGGSRRALPLDLEGQADCELIGDPNQRSDAPHGL